jgi:RNA polymerase sigma-70 factor (ECF subfamily)
MTEAPIDIAEFGRLVHRHRPGLELYCHLMLGCPRKAEDAVQETVLRAWLGLEPVEQRGSARIWLYRIATRACLEELERGR